MVEVNEALTRKVADLARMELTDAEVRLFTGQLGKILGHIEQLQEIPVEGIEPLISPVEHGSAAQAGGRPELREDRVEAFALTAEGEPRTLSPAPEVVDGGFRVPPVL